MAEIAAAAGSKAAEKVTETVYDFICRKISYVFKYQKYMEKAKEQVKEVRSRKRDVEADVDVAERQGEEIYNEVKDWLRGVEGFMEREVKLVDDEDKAKRRCFKGLCPDLVKRYRLSKDAEQVAEDGAKLLEKGKFSGVSHPVILQRTESIFVGEEYEHFHSRESNFKDIMEALKDSTVNMIGVYGMGGVGKTTLVRKVAWKAKEDNLFDEVVFAEVTQIPDLKQIQADIAGQLGMVFRDQESLSGRADQLRYRLKKAKRIIVLVDNIWKKLDLKVVGIPFSYDDKGSLQQDKKESNDEQVRCTILLTARTQVVLQQMNTQRIVSVGPLGDDDARNLFGNIVGDLTDKCDITAEIIEKCAGLPLAITTIANALKGKSDYVWKDALHQLKSNNPRCVPDMDDTLYSAIELSYKLLNREEAKSLLLLCALFNAGSDIDFFSLLEYGTGLGLFEDVYTIRDRWNRIKSLIDYLEASCLLLKGIHNETVKMHDVIHLVVASIAKEKCMFNIQDGNGFKEVLVKKMYKDSIAISLPYGDIDGLPERVNFPNLVLFTLHLKKDHFLQIPTHFFEGVKELKVLDLYNVHLLPLPLSFLCLTNLQTLGLTNCTLGDMTMIGELRNLEILSFLSCEFEQVPERFRQLTQLKILQLTDCPKIEVITPNVIASLSRLEELYIDNSFDRWEVDGRNNASLAELKRLSKLNTLWIHIPNLQIIQQNFIPENLEEYNVHIGDACEWSYDYETPRTLRLKFNRSFHLRYGVEILVKKAKDLYLDQLDGVKDILWELDREGFPQLKRLSVKNSSEILYIVNSMWCTSSNDAFPILESLFLINLGNMEKICCGLVDSKSFSKLTIIKVQKCDKLKYLFSSSMAGNISWIQEIELTDCKELKEIFGQESAYHVDENYKVEFKQLHSLVLQCLPQFISFGLKVVLPRLENLKLSSINIENIWVDQHQPMSSYIQCLKSLTVEECNGLKFMFSSSIVKSLVQLQKLVICNCKSMEAVIFDSEGLEGEDKIIDLISFPKLFYLKLEGLPQLTRFGTGNSIELPTLNELHFESCSNLKTFFHNSFGADTLRMELDEVSLENHITDINPLFNEKVAFTSLEKMILFHLDNLQLIWHNQLHGDSFSKLKEVRVKFCEKLITTVPSNSTQGLLTFHNLETLTVENCWNMKSLFPVSIATGLLQLKKLWISSCGLEEIVAKEEVDGTPTFLFPQLTFLKLQNLAKLRHFYLGLHTIEWPMLKRLVMYNCGKTKVYASDGESQPALFSFEKVMPNLENLGLDGDYITSRCLDRIPARSFSKLKFLSLAYLDKKSVAFWFGVLKKLYHLDSLYLYDCTFQELFPYEGYLWKKDSQVDTFLQNLQTLEIWRCHRLTYLMSSSTISFKNIKNLKVHYCNGLANILACSTARVLIHLTTIRITECKLVTEVIATEVETTEKEIVFSQLKILELHCLTSLTSFSSANCAFEFPCLEQVIVSQCPNLKIFSRGDLSTPKLKRVQLTKKMDEEYLWNDDLNSTIHQMFTNMVGFREFGHLKLGEFPTLKENIWNGKVPIDLFYNLKSLVLDGLSDVATVIPSNVLSYFKYVETIEVKGCDSLKKVFDMEEQLDYVDGHTTKRSHHEILGFKNLKSLKVDNCNNLRYIFTASFVSSLVQLEQIEIRSCALVEEIITKKGEKNVVIDKIEIPLLKSINLESLPSLTSFYSGSSILECPPLETIIIKDCQNIHLKDFSLHLPSLFSENVAFPTMDDLTLYSIIAEWTWQSQLPATSSCFEKLTILVIDGFDHLKYFFSSSMVKSLLELKELEISNCKLIEGIIDEDEERTNTVLFPKLYQLKLRDLPKLTTFCHSTGNFVELSSLFRLWITNCPGIKSFVSNSIWSDTTSTRKLEERTSSENLPAHMQSLFDKKVRLPCLERLVISYADELVKIWDDQVSLDSFCKLNRVFVYFCNKILNIFPSNMFGRHQELEMLEVQNCDSIEEIFEVLENRSGPEEEIVANEEACHRFVFSKLTRLRLQMLPSLKSLYPKIHISEWPVLDELKVHGCNNVETLASEFLSIRGTHGQSQNETPNQKPLFLVYKDAFPRLEELELFEMPRLLHLWRGNPQPNSAFPNLKTLKLSECGSLDSSWSSLVSFQNLESLQVSKCDGLRYLLSLSKAKTLKWLTSMNISECKMMDQIISNLEGEVMEDSIAFNNLNNLEIHCLPSLTSFCGGDINLEFPSLRKVFVKQCLKMEIFCLGVLSTPKLQTLQLIEGEDEVEECGEGNLELNSAIQQLFNKRNVQSS